MFSFLTVLVVVLSVCFGSDSDSNSNNGNKMGKAKDECFMSTSMFLDAVGRRLSGGNTNSFNEIVMDTTTDDFSLTSTLVAKTWNSREEFLDETEGYSISIFNAWGNWAKHFVSVFGSNILSSRKGNTIVLTVPTRNTIKFMDGSIFWEDEYNHYTCKKIKGKWRLQLWETDFSDVIN